jgi:hypothetical protein
MSSKTTFPFPHETLTVLTHKPNAATIKLLTKEVYANAKSVHSVHGGGLNGHLGIAMAAAPYQIRAGALFIAPPHPGAQPVHIATATAAQITAANRAYDQDMTDFNTCQTIKESIKQQILNAVDNIYLQDLEDDVFGYADVTIIEILQHLRTTYGLLTANDLEVNRNQLTEPWNPDEPFENIWKQIKIIRAVAIAGNEAISDQVTIELTLMALDKAGVYDHAITIWHDKPDAEQTWDIFIAHFNKQEKQRIKKLTAKAAGYHGANQATLIPPNDEPPNQQIAAAATPQEQQQRFKSNDSPLYYCWTHGLAKNPDHTSQNCSRPDEGHQKEATVENRLGGINKINFGRSGKPRRQRQPD